MGSAAAPWEKYSQATDESGPWQKYGAEPKEAARPEAPNQGLPEGELPLDSYGNATLQGIANVGKGAIGAVQGAYNTIAHPIDTAKSILSLPSQAKQVPAAIKDINASADPAGTYAKVAGETAGEGAGQAIIGALGEQAPGIAKDAIQGIGPKTKALAKVGAQYGASKVPIVGGFVRRPSYGDALNAIRAKSPAIEPAAEGSAIPTTELQEKTALPPQEPARGLGLVKQKSLPPASQTGEALGSIPTEGQRAMENLRPLPDEEVFDKVALPKDDHPALPTRGDSATAIDTRPTPKKVENLLNEGLGGKSLLPNVSLRNQIPGKAPAGHAAVESSAIKSYKYDPAAKEFEFVTPSGAHYIHGDVSPEQVADFEKAASKGKAFNEIKKNSTYVGKVVNGKRVNVRPPKGLASAGPD